MADDGAVKATAKTESPAAKKDAPAAMSGSMPASMFDSAEFSRMTGRNMEAATRVARACFNGAAKFNQEWINFVNSRVRKDFESAQAIMAAKSGEEALHAQAEFFESAFRDYADEASKMLNFAADLAKESLKPAE